MDDFSRMAPRLLAFYGRTLASYCICPALDLDRKEDQFVHSEHIYLIDTLGYVRGIYNGNNRHEVKKIIKDIEILSGNPDADQVDPT